MTAPRYTPFRYAHSCFPSSSRSFVFQAPVVSAEPRPMRKVTAAAGSVLGKGGGLLTGRLLRAISMLPPRQRVCLGPVRRAVACWSYRSRENLGIGQVERPVRGIQPDVGDADLGHGSEELAAQWA